jgi:hypothetical protein
MTPEEARELNLEPIEATPDGKVKYGRAAVGSQSGATRFQLIKGELGLNNQKSPDRIFDPLSGMVWNEGDPVPEAVQAARRPAGAQPAAAAAKPTYNPFQ